MIDGHNYHETEGYCVVQGRRLHYWLYKKKYSAADDDVLINKLVEYSKKLGWVVGRGSSALPNKELAYSVKEMMISAGADLSMTIIENGAKSATLVINNYSVSNGYEDCWSDFYPLTR